MKRRDFLKGVTSGIVISASGGPITRFALADPIAMGPAELPSGTLESAVLEALPGKKPLIKRSFRPPNFETPVTYFNELFTPNDAFFVRYHLVNIPEVNAQAWKLRIGGESVAKPLEFTLDELKSSFEQVEIAAVNQCSGNRRGLVQPHVPGVQWGYGAMGNARWRGVKLKEVLDRAGVKKDALEVVIDGADTGALAQTPDFIKSLPLWKALDEHTLIAFEMNGEPLPHWNGYPARLVVPGWTATYWVKQLRSIDVVSKPFDGFWMKTAYRVPKGTFPMVDRFLSQETEVNTPITEMMVNSLITNIEDRQRFNLGQWIEVKGIAWDGGYGIERVEVSTDEGKFWRLAELGEEHGRFSWRQWRFQFKPQEKGTYSIMVKATNRIGGTQTFQWIQNPAGYHHNRVQKLTILVAG
jgi:DMSO/TMAO reductase YedYZ molybdopterin-dependent catalytic subunit